MGQSRRFDCVPPTSALPPSTDIVRSARQVRFVPDADIPTEASPQMPLIRRERRVLRAVPMSVGVQTVNSPWRPQPEA